MKSCDVHSLFTDVLINELIDITSNTSEENIGIKLPLDEWGQLIILCTSNIQFLFDVHYYRYKDE